MHYAELYQQSNLAQKRDAYSCLEKYAQKLKWKNDYNRILDIGCGDGSVTNILKKYIPSDYTLVGADISKEMVKFAAEKNNEEHRRFIIMDIASDVPSMIKERFDFIFSSYTFHWVINQKRAFSNIFNMLGENGQCLMIFLAYHSVFEVYRALSRNIKWNTWVYNVDDYISPYHDSEEPDKEVMTLMKNIGFINIHVECEDKVFLYDDINVMKKHMTAINPFQIPKDMNDEFMKDYTQILKEIELTHTYDESKTSRGGTVHYKLLTAVGQKCTNIEDSTNVY